MEAEEGRAGRRGVCVTANTRKYTAVRVMGPSRRVRFLVRNTMLHKNRAKCKIIIHITV
ncbi:protein of unknown function [Rhodovastum atsumiense]|nr:protein of unknown function [Rhodovastum atsumiense]